ncbi:DUF2059 domain-containing protein [Roseovarius rhodophyticola]|uniref:DUF2059 domain-containing protein n=1 Tax=Roseovarius rhodophyticola TaxID=3080827 RepID=A0ABZ2TEA3_9RHOB|nr:DUF2059 domain-containing protein [Roseovarius sp. W115]MDV2928257.1 DUF2059 domain-containing protein [Roseovarius sp. W115]
MRNVTLFRPLIWLTILGVVLVLSLPARAAERDRLEAFLQVTGFDVALESIGLAAGDAPGLLGMQASDFGADWKRTADEVFDTETMHNMAMDILEAALSDDLLTHAAAFYASPLGQRLVEAENASHMANDEAKQSEGTALVADWVAEGDARVNVLRQLNQAVDAADSGVRAVQEIQVRFFVAASRSGILDYDIDEETLRRVIKQGEAELRVSLQVSALANAAYTYQDFSEEDIRAYLEALEHPDMQLVYELMNAVQYEIMANRFEILAGRMADLHPGQEL